MPFKSKAQWRACFAQQAAGRGGSWNCREWAHATPSYKRLPKKKKKRIEKKAVTIAERYPFILRPLTVIPGRSMGLNILPLTTLAPLRRSPTMSEPILPLDKDLAKPFTGREFSEELRDAIRDYEKNKGEEERRFPLEVQLGGMRPLRYYGRLWRNPRIGPLSKILGSVIGLPYYALMEALRADNYSPFAHTVTLYNNDPAILRHELGHAEDFGRKAFPTSKIYLHNLIPSPLYRWFDTLQKEYTATRIAMDKILKNPKSTPADIRRANRVLTAALTTYILSGGIPGLGKVVNTVGLPLLGAAYGHLAQPWGRTKADITGLKGSIGVIHPSYKGKINNPLDTDLVQMRASKKFMKAFDTITHSRLFNRLAEAADKLTRPIRYFKPFRYLSNAADFKTYEQSGFNMLKAIEKEVEDYKKMRAKEKTESQRVKEDSRGKEEKAKRKKDKDKDKEEPRRKAASANDIGMLEITPTVLSLLVGHVAK